MDGLELLRQRVRAAPIDIPPSPWIAMGSLAVPGITEVGFAEESETLLIISSHSRELIDCRAGKRLAHDTAVEHQSAWIGSHDLIGNGFAGLSGRQIRLAGISGGGLVSLTRDGWGAVRLPIDWPEEFLVLTSPFSSIYNPESAFWKVAITREPIAWGFSYSGHSLVAATGESVTVFSRE